jgi:hypothetical protein
VRGAGVSLLALLEKMNAPKPRNAQMEANARWRAKNPGKQQAYDREYQRRKRRAKQS